MHDHASREASTFNQLADIGMRHFSNIYKAPRGATLPEIIRIAEVIPIFVESKEVKALNALVSQGELEAMLKCFNKDKIPRLDRWPMEFYNTFIELIGSDLLLDI